MSEKTVYRASRYRGMPFLFGGALFMAIGLFSASGRIKITDEGDKEPVSFGFSIGFFVLGSIAFVAGVALVRTRVMVDDAGICKSPRWPGGGFMARWEDIETWWVEPYTGEDTFTYRVARFQIRGKDQPLTVWDSDARRPGFDAFLGDVQSRRKTGLDD